MEDDGVRCMGFMLPGASEPVRLDIILTLRRVVVAAVFGGFLAICSPSATACGFEDPSGASTQRGLLNFAFPRSLWVSTAVWQAQAEGVLDRGTASPAVRGLMGFREATSALSALAASIEEEAEKGASLPPFSLVLIGPMLWTRFDERDGQLVARPHVSGPSGGDVVVVTDEPVILALAGGRITPNVALQRGLIRLYGNPARVAVLDGILRRAIVAH